MNLQKKYYSSLRFLDRLKWWFLYRFHPKHRYHVMKTGFEPGWRDRDTVLVWMIVKIFKDFIEKEKPFEWLDTEDSSSKEDWDKIKSLYEYFKEFKPEDANNNKVLREKYPDLEEKLFEIIRLRSHYWT